MGDFEIVVDEQDAIIGSKHWRDKSHQDIYRVSALWLTDATSGDVLIAQRKWTKINDPGKWAEAVAGTNEESETYESNMVKEIAEEIGLTDIAITPGPKLYIDDGKHRFFCQWYIAAVDKNVTDITIQESEVEAVKWVAKDWLLQDVAEHPETYTPMIPKFLQAYYNIQE